jgi:nitroreductase
MNEPGFEPLVFQELPPEEMIARSAAFYAAMQQRRTVRDFSARPVAEEVIRNALLAAGTAPSGANLQPWHFVVVSDPATKREIREEAEAGERAFYQGRASEEWLQALAPLATNASKPFLEIAPYLIVIFLKKAFVDEDGQTRKTYYPVESVGIATGMLITALHLAGLATLTYTPSPMSFLSRILRRPDSERPFLVLVTGYPAEDAHVPSIHKLPLERIATFDAGSPG